MNDKKIFSIKLFINNFLQLKVMGILGTVLITLFSVLSIVSQGISMIEYTKEGISVNGMSGGVSTTYLGAGDLWPLVLTFVFVTPVLMLMAFSYNNKRNSSDFYNSLPYTRLNMYLTKLSAVFTWQFIVYVCTVAGIVISIAVYKKYFVYSVNTITWLIIGTFICNLLCGAVIALACSLTGSLMSNICLTGIILFIPAILRVMVTSGISALFDYASHIQAVPLIGVERNMISALVVGGALNGIQYNEILLNKGYMVYSLVLAIVYAVIGYLCFVRRKSEVAGKAALGNKIHVIIRTVIGFICMAVGFLLLLIERDIISMIIFVSLAVAAMIIYELIAGDRSRLGFKTGISSVIALAAAGIFTGLLWSGSIVMKAYKPETSRIKYAVVESNSYYHYYYSSDSLSDYYSTKTAQYRIKDSDIIDILVNGYNYCKDKTYTELSPSRKNVYTINVYFKDGIIGTRRAIALTEDDYNNLMLKLGNDEEYQKIYLELPEFKNVSLTFNNDVNLSDSDKQNIYNSLQSEIKKVGYNQYIKSFDQTGVYDSVNIKFVENGKNYYIRIPFSEYLPETTETFMKMVNKGSLNYALGSVTSKDAKELVKSAFDNKLSISGDYYYLNVEVLEINLPEQRQTTLYDAYNNGTSRMDDVITNDTKERTGFDKDVIIDKLNRLNADTPVDPLKSFYQVNVRIQYSDDYVEYYFYIQ